MTPRTLRTSGTRVQGVYLLWLARRHVRRFDERTRKSLNGKVRYLLEEKFDGASIELVYESGILARAVTRGDGREGDRQVLDLRAVEQLAHLRQDLLRADDGLTESDAVGVAQHGHDALAP